MTRFAICLALSCVLFAPGCRAQPSPKPPPLALERQIPLPQVDGRIDHLAIDVSGKRLFVAELGNGTVDVVDLTQGRVIHRIDGLREPQGLGFLPAEHQIVVASGGDGAVRFYDANSFALLDTLRLGADADDVRVLQPSGRVAVGFGGGALAVIDPADRQVVSEVALPAHPEAFEFSGERAFVNIPDANEVAVVDERAQRIVATWKNPQARFNFPMAIDRRAGNVAVIYRLPARLILFRAEDGQVVQREPTCGDADDVSVDESRHRLYVVCGGGAVDVFGSSDGRYAHIAHIQTADGARTGLYDPTLDRLYVAVRAGVSAPAAVQVYRPQ